MPAQTPIITPLKILFICTHNRCRSILSESITQQLANGAIQARSAGSQPVGQVHPLSLKYLAQQGYSVEGLQSQSWDDFEDFEPTLVITVCDSAAGEACPLYFGNSVKMHWGLSDPSKVKGDEQTVKQAFLDCIGQIEGRAQVLKDIAEQGLSGQQLKNSLIEHGAS
jgi:protein-tyrosine-phosphatase